MNHHILSMCAPLLAILAGIAAARPSGVTSLAFLPNLVAAFLGVTIVLMLPNFISAFRKNITLVTAFAIALFGLSLIESGLESVHRWIKIGPIFLNVSMAFAPIVLYGMVYSTRLMSISFSAILSLIYIFQPDGGQATAFACACLVIFLAKSSWGIPARFIGIIIVATSATITWLRPDPLGPVPHVERIFHLALSQGLPFFVFCVCAASVSLLPFVWIFREESDRQLRLLSIVYLVFLLAEFSVTEFGNFPTPLIGAGAAPVLGWYIMFGLQSNTSNVGIYSIVGILRPEGSRK